MLLGVLWSVCSNEIDGFINTRLKKWLGVFFSLALCGVIKLISTFLPSNTAYVLQVTGTAIFFVIAIILCIKGVSLVNPVLDYLGKISLEIYVFQGAVILILRKLNITNLFLYVIFVLTGTILLATIMHPVLKNVHKPAKNKSR